MNRWISCANSYRPSSLWTLCSHIHELTRRHCFRHRCVEHNYFVMTNAVTETAEYVGLLLQHFKHLSTFWFILNIHVWVVLETLVLKSVDAAYMHAYELISDYFLKLMSAIGHMDWVGCGQGRLSPQQPWRSFPPFSRLPPLFLHPAPTISRHFIRNFVQFYACFQWILEAGSQG